MSVGQEVTYVWLIIHGSSYKNDPPTVDMYSVDKLPSELIELTDEIISKCAEDEALYYDLKPDPSITDDLEAEKAYEKLKLKRDKDIDAARIEFDCNSGIPHKYCITRVLSLSV